MVTGSSMWPTDSPVSAFERRRAALARALGKRRAIFAAGSPRARNFPANPHPYRAESHFLYFVGRPIAGAALLFDGERAALFVPRPDPSDALWHGVRPTFADLAEALRLDVRPLDELDAALAAARATVATLPPNDGATASFLSRLLGRPILARSGAKVTGIDAALADAVIALRLAHDEAAVAQMRQAVAATALAHAAGMRSTRPGVREAAIRAAMEAELVAAGMTTSYGSIVTVHGEVLHNEEHGNLVGEGDLVLADVGGETPEGFAADVTRTWPASGAFSPTQRDAYDVVLAANRAAIAKVRPGVRYRSVHETAARTLVEGLVALGILRGSVDSLVERGAHALFFPHGVGHLLGLDVHDMEDLGDRAGYAPGRERSTRFGDRYLRLDRDLHPGMAVTIEPGFYQVPAILADATIAGPFASELDRARLAQFADVRGIRLEDDVLCRDGEPEVLTAGIPKERDAVEAAMRRR